LQMTLEGFPTVAVCTMGRALSRIGARLGTPKPVVLCPWLRERKLRVLAAIRKLEACASAKEPVLYSDEVDIHLNPKIGRDWMLRGHQRRIVTPGNNEKFYLAGALDVRTGRLHTTGAARENAGLFCQLLWLLASRYRRALRIHLVVDNYGVHSAHRTRRVLAALGGRIVLLSWLKTRFASRSSSSPADVAMVQPADAREGHDDVALAERLRGARHGCVPGETHVRTVLVAITCVEPDQAKQVAFTQDDDVVEEFAAQCPHEPLYVPILPRRSRSDAHLLDAEVVDTPVEHGAIDSVAIANQADDVGIHSDASVICCAVHAACG
jgi:DDE superfamily endonuclease